MRKIVIAAALVLLFFVAQNGFAQTSAIPPPNQDPPSAPTQKTPSIPAQKTPSAPAERTPSAPKQRQPSTPVPGEENEGTTLVLAFPMSAGGRIFYNGMFRTLDTKVGQGSESVSSDINGFGIGGFFDATYVEIGMDFIFSSYKYTYSRHGYYTESGEVEQKLTHFGFSIIGKYPFVLEKLTVFPLLGIDYQIFISGSKNNGDTLSRDDLGYYDDEYDVFSVAVGGGLDYTLVGKLYLRGELLFNFKVLDSKSESMARYDSKENSEAFSLFTWGPRVSVGVGYKL
jgi:hypothetical protein